MAQEFLTIYRRIKAQFTLACYEMKVLDRHTDME